MFQELLNLDELIPMLYQTGILTKAELDEVRQENSRNMKIVCFVTTMCGKGKKGTQRLIECLEKEKKHLGHEDLAEELKKGIAQYCACIVLKQYHLAPACMLTYVPLYMQSIINWPSETPFSESYILSYCTCFQIIS